MPNRHHMVALLLGRTPVEQEQRGRAPSVQVEPRGLVSF